MSVRVMAGILQGIQKSQDRAMQIRAARDAKRQKDEMLGLEKRKLDLAEQELNLKQGPDPTLEMILNMGRDEIKAKEAISTVENNQIMMAEKKEQDRIGTLQRVGRKAAMSLISGQQGDVEGNPVESTEPKISKSIPGKYPSQESPRSFLDNFDISYNTGSRSMTIAPKDKLKIQREERLAREQDLRDSRFDIQTLQKTGGIVTKEKLDEFSKNLGFDITSEFSGDVDSGRATRMVDKDGNVAYKILSDKEYDRMVQEGKFSPEEQKHIRTLAEEHNAWARVVRRLDEIGVKQLGELGEVKFEKTDNPFLREIGVTSIPARFSLARQYADDPRLQAISREIELAFQKFRTRVTGAQASDKEIERLRGVIAKLTDQPKVFFETIRDFMEDSKEDFNVLLGIKKQFGRDISQFDNMIEEVSPSVNKGQQSFQLNEEREIPGKGRFRHIGNGQWERVK